MMLGTNPIQTGEVVCFVWTRSRCREELYLPDIDSVKENAYTQLLVLVAFILLALVLYDIVIQRSQEDQVLEHLQSIDPQEVTAFNIYPRVIIPTGAPHVFQPPDPLIEAFFKALQDLHAYSYSHDTVDSPDQSGFIEIVTTQEVLQMHCHLPSGTDGIVAIEFGKWEKGRSSHYGHVQSRWLVQWYDTYRMQWLNDAESS